ncbi:hypothetical protein F5Y11DRAFT_195980 [Daldinia sp. FL1419]|nr:hypothetical protein F5Y11DRAFT_195980 [Daldinia sp. FL1419]
MAPSISSAGFLNLLPATAILLLAAVFELANGHVLPRQTKTVELHELNVVPFPRPTEAPVLLSDLLRRQGQNTVCGFIGGHPNLPATCQIGSHCVLEQDHGVVGCCPDGGTCSTGIFTGCVDRNSDLQTEINPYVYTCQGSDVCYRNEFAGGYFQFGCGTASSLGTTVETSVDGMTSLVFEETAVLLTASPAALSEPTSIGSQPSSATDDPNPDPPLSGTETASPASQAPPATTDPSSASESEHTSPPSYITTSSQVSSRASSSPTSPLSSSSSSSSTSSTLTSSSSATTSPSSTTSTTTWPSITSSFGTDPTDSTSPIPEPGASHTNRGAIIGGSISGAAILIGIIVAVVLFFLRKRRGNNRQGPGPLPTEAPPRTGYTSPMSHGAAFAPLPSWQDEEEDRKPLTQYNSQPYRSVPEPPPPPPPRTAGSGMAMAAARTAPLTRGFPQPLRYHPPTIRLVPPMGVGTGLSPVAEEDNPQDQDSSCGSDREFDNISINRGPTPSEIDDFSRAYMSAGIGTRELEEDRQPLTDGSAFRSGAESPGGSQSPPRGNGTGNRPLWQQNRQQGRNLMWL